MRVGATRASPQVLIQSLGLVTKTQQLPSVGTGPPSTAHVSAAVELESAKALETVVNTQTRVSLWLPRGSFEAMGTCF